jgi:hypothetical protein
MNIKHEIKKAPLLSLRDYYYSLKSDIILIILVNFFNDQYLQ